MSGVQAGLAQPLAAYYGADVFFNLHSKFRVSLDCSNVVSVSAQRPPFIFDDVWCKMEWNGGEMQR